MGLRTYKATGVMLGALGNRLHVRMIPSGLENLRDQPTLFVVNHFTRFETLVVPYVLYRSTRRQVRTLADAGLFSGYLGRYLRACGVMSTRDAARNRTIVRELMTRSYDWVIYPEGGLVKSKKTVENGKLMLDLPHRSGSPHTGAAVLALKAEICKRAYRNACERGDRERRSHYEQRYGLSDPGQLASEETLIVPTTITYSKLRSDRRAFLKLASLLGRELSPRAQEELRVEGSLLLGDCEIGVHFDEPIEVGKHLRGPVNAARRVHGMLTGRTLDDLLLKGTARRLTDTFMRTIYSNVEINFDHLFCYAITRLGRNQFDEMSLRQALFVAAETLSQDPTVRLHASLEDGLARLLTGVEYKPLKEALKLATDEGVVSESGGVYQIHRDVLDRQYEFHSLRLGGMTRVIANEIEPVNVATKAIRAAFDLNEAELKTRANRSARRRDLHLYDREYHQVAASEQVQSRAHGEPYLLEGKDSRVGVLLAHGYLSCPEETRPLADALNARGYTVYGVRLAGHGTAPAQLAVVRWQQWLNSLLRGYASLQSRCDAVVVGGFSLGGVLALHMAAGGNPVMRGVFTINAPIRLNDVRANLVPAMLKWNSVARAVGISKGEATRPNDRTESPDINYMTDYLAGLRELRLAMKACHRLLGDVTAPALVIQSLADPVVHATSARTIVSKISSVEKNLVELPGDRHVIIRGSDSDPLAETISTFIERIGSRGEQTGDVAF